MGGKCFFFFVSLQRKTILPMKKKKESTEKKERKANWKEYTATVEEIQDFLADRIFLRHNVITGRVEYKAPLVPPDWGDDTTQDSSSPSRGRSGGGRWAPISDRVVNSLWAELSATKAVRVQDMYRVIESDFVPVQLYFRRPADREPGEFVSVALALQMVGAGITQKLSSVLLGRAFMYQS